MAWAEATSAVPHVGTGLKEALLWSGTRTHASSAWLYHQLTFLGYVPVRPWAGLFSSLGLRFPTDVSRVAGCLMPSGTVHGDVTTGGERVR